MSGIKKGTPVSPTELAVDLIDKRLNEMKLVRAWLSQNVAILDACIAAMEVQSKNVELVNLVPLVNPLQWWLDLMTGDKDKE